MYARASSAYSGVVESGEPLKFVTALAANNRVCVCAQGRLQHFLKDLTVVRGCWRFESQGLKDTGSNRGMDRDRHILVWQALCSLAMPLCACLLYHTEGKSFRQSIELDNSLEEKMASEYKDLT